MSDSGDCSDAEVNQPSYSRNAAQNSDREKRKRRIIMRIEFNDSDDSDLDDACPLSINDNCDSAVASVGAGIDLGAQPSCSSVSQLCRSTCSNLKQLPHTDGPPRLSARHFRKHRGTNHRHSDEPICCASSSGSEIDQQPTSKRERERKRKKYIMGKSNVEQRANDITRTGVNEDADVASISDSSCSSSNELLEKCPICLLSFRKQEIGTPVTCEHTFCAACIEAWAKNVQTCPIDRIAFDKIIVLETFERRKIVREIHVDLNNSKKELVINDETDVADFATNADDVTNCEICNCPDREDIMLLCDSCNQGYHMDCLDPPLYEIPEGSWYCDNCIDSNDEAEDEDLELAEDLHTLYEDIRGMGLPETRLRVRQVQQPRILRTRQNERIREAVLRHTRSNSSRHSTTGTRALLEPTMMTHATSRRNRNSTTTTRSTSTSTTATGNRASSQRRRRKRTQHRTYVVEYDLNNFDEKFAIKTSKKVIRRRRRRKITHRNRSQIAGKSLADGVRVSASKRLAEQLGVKIDTLRGSHINGGSASSFTLFGNANDLEYFSDSDDVGEDQYLGAQTDNGYTAVQTSVRIGSIGAPRNRKALLLGKARTAASAHSSAATAASDILSNIMDLQDRWHDASRNLSEVRIHADGSLNFPKRVITTATNKSTKQTEFTKPTEHITQVPLYQRGGAGPNFGRGGGGNYNNRYSGSNSNYRGGGGSGSGVANQYQSHSAGGVGNSSDNAPTTDSFGNQSFNSNNNSNNSGSSSNNSTPNTNFTPFNIRFNSPNQQQQQRNQNMPQPRQLPYSSSVRMLASSAASPSTSFAHIIPQQQQQQQTQLFDSRSAPINAPVLGSRISMPPVLSVPPPPTPPPSLSWNSSLFKLNTDYDNTEKDDDDDDAENCPNFSIYSQESQAVATELFAEPQTATRNSEKDEDEMNEDLVQLDDDDDIPLPPEPQSDAVNANEDHNTGSDLYQPENPTDEQDEVQNEVIAKPIQSGYGDVKECNTNVEANNSNCEPSGKQPDDDDETKTHSTPSPTLKDSRAVERGKGVLELYDDSDWEELEIDKPKEFEKALLEEKSDGTLVVASNETTEGGASAKTSISESDQDRSYTPCLDEKNMEEDTTSAQHNDKSESQDEAKNIDSKKSNNEDDDEERAPGMGTELISEEEDLANENEPKRRSRSRHRNEGECTAGKSKRSTKRGKENSETFKKLGKRRKDRNYRGEKLQQHSQPQDRSRSRRSHSNTPRSATRSCTRSRSPNRSRSLTKSPRGRRRDSRSKSYSRSRSHSRSPYSGRQRASFRGREYVRGFGRGRGGLRFNFRNQQFHNRPYQQQHHHQHQYHQQYHHQHQYQNQYNSQPFHQRPKRRELPRYDVRNVVSTSRHLQKDRYGRDAARSARSRSVSYERRKHSRSYSRGSTRSRTRSVSPKRFRSFSISPSPPPPVAGHRHEHGIRRRSMSPGDRRFERSPSNSQPAAAAAHRNSPLQQIHRSNSTISLRSRSNTPARMNGGRNLPGAQHSPGYSPRYTPRLSRSRSKSPKKRKKKKVDKKKKSKKRAASSSPATRQRRISRQRDPFDDTDDFLAPQVGKKSKKTSGIGPTHWSPSPTPSISAEHLNFMHESGGEAGGDKPASWTPPLTSPQAPGAHYIDNLCRTISPVTGKKVKSKRDKGKKNKKKPVDKQRKDKKRKRRTMTPEPVPSKEVFASGNNILVSVSFNKEVNSSALTGSAPQTVVTLPPTRDEFLGNRRTSIDRLTNSSGKAIKKTKRKRKKLDAKPVAIIDLERSPFQVHQEPTDVIVLTDSEDANDNQLLMRRDRRRGSAASATNHDLLRENGQREKTPPTDCLDTILETSYENLTQTTGPKTPPEPHLVKFNLPAKKQHKVRNNPLHDDADDIHSANELETACSMRSAIESEPQQQHVNDGLISTQKIGPNTPPESGPCSPDAYDPFEPTKSPSLSPRSPTPNPAQTLEPINLQASTSGDVESIDSMAGAQKHSNHSDELVDTNASTPTLSTANSGTTQANANVSINPVELVMALMSKPSNSNQQELTNKSCDGSSSQYLTGGTMSSALAISGADDIPTDNVNTIQVLSNVLLSSSTIVSSASQHMPVISSPQTTLARKLTTLSKTGGSVASSSSGIVNLPTNSGTLRNGSTVGGGALDDSFSMDIESPYSPGSADYEDLFEPPPEGGGNAIGSIRRSKGSGASGLGKAEMFDNLFGSSSPVGQLRISSRYNNTGGRKQPRANNKTERKSKVKVSGNKLAEDHVKLYDDLPNSAVDLQVKDRFLRKLNRQERVVEEVKLVLKPHFNKKVITKEDYKDIMRRAVPKICHSRSGEINPHKIKNLIDAYVRKFRAKHKKLSLLNTGQVSSAVKCAAYLKKL